ncbi:MAG: o-succinylbenzoate--CoA ligase [Chloroflexota bacterium]
MQDWLAMRASASPEKIAIIEHLSATETNEISYKHLNWRVDDMCRRMLNAGIEQGQHVGMIMMNSVLAIVPFFAAMRLGIVFVPINARLTIDEMDFQLRQADCDWLLPYALTDTLAGLRDKGHRLANIEQKPKKKITIPEREIDLDAPFFIVHTSGTSGKPKGATLTYGNVFYSAMASAYRIGHLPDDKWLCVLPLYHVGGLSIFIRALLYGITVDLRQSFDVQTINHALTYDAVTLVSLVPTMLFRLLREREGDWYPALRLVLLGGAAATPELMQQCLDENIPVATTYGLTEASSQVATTLPGDAARKPGTVGKPLSFTQVKIVDEAGNPQKQGEYGEILVKGLSVMHGYYNNPDATAEVLRDGWLHTGDIGYLDADGDLWLVQRRSDLIVSGGENVYPAEVEGVLRQHPAIAEVAVVGIDDPEWGQRVAAAIVVEAGATLSQDEVESYSREHLAGYKIPRIVRFVESLPLTGSGKVQRPAVRELFAD